MADDGKGGTAQATFTTESNSKAPTATIHGATASVTEGATITLTASAISDSAEDNNAGFSFKWTATEYGNALPGSTGATYVLKVDDEGSYAITLQATDDGGVPSAIVSATIAAGDSKPTVSGLQVSNPMIVTTQQTLSFSGTYADDGAAVDSAYKASWNFGDGSSGAGLTATHAYTASGTYTATLTVADDDGTAGSATTTVTVLSPLQALGKIGTYLQGLTDLKEGQKNSLQAKINAAAASYQRGDTGAACNQMNAFINEVDADQKSGRLTTAEAGNLTDAARLTQRSMGCFKPLVEFLSGL
jgi:PKD repeat protein